VYIMGCETEGEKGGMDIKEAAEAWPS
jgi:hypothetical protein